MSTNMSVLNLTHQCLDRLNEAMSGKNDTEHRGHLENRLASFNLWVDNVGALAKSGASLDSRFRSRPDDLDLVKNILSLLSDFLDEYIDTIHKGLPIEVALVNIDSAIRNLAKIGVAIRRTGKASRSRKAHQSFNPNEHHEFKRHMECLILLRPKEDQGISSIDALMIHVSAESSKKHDILKAKLEQLAKSRMEDLDSSRLNEIQKRLVEANLRRRHNFLLAQRRSQRIKKTAQTTLTPDKHQPDIALLRITELPLRAKAIDQVNDLASLEPEDGPTKNKALPTVTGYTIASTAEGTLQFNLAKSQQHAPTVARSQISFIAANTEFPRPPSSSQSQLMSNCPCCCQSLPSEDFTSPSRWRQHLIEDLCPYTCVAQSCPTPDKLFTTRKAWEHHFENDHLPQWQCLLCNEEDEPFSSKEDIITHTLSQHQQELSKYELPFLLSSAEVRHMGIESCPLCSSRGPRDSTELVDHVVRHAYEFALRALPWPQPVMENLNTPIGTFSLPEDTSNAEQLEKWLDSLQDTAEELSVSSFDKMDHSLLETTDNTPTEDYFAYNDYFEDKESAGSSKRQTVQGRSSIGWSKSSDLGLADQKNVDDATQAAIDLIAAVSRGDEDAVRPLIEGSQTFDCDGEIRKRALIAAIQRGHIPIVKRLLESGIDINSQYEYSQTALFFAIKRNDKSMMQYLIQLGIDTSIKDHDGLTALHIAIQKGDKKIIHALFTPNVYKRFKDVQGQEAILWAREQGHLLAAQFLSELQTKYELILSRAQKTFNIEGRAAAARTIMQGDGWYALIDPLLEPLYFNLVGTLPHRGGVSSVAFSHDGKYIATGDGRGSAQVFDIETRRNVFRTGLWTNEDVFGICFSPDGQFLATTSGNLVEVWEIATRNIQYSFIPNKLAYALDISNDGRLIAFGAYAGTVHIWDLEQELEVKKVTAGMTSVCSVKISPDSSFVAACCRDRYAYIWNLKTDASKGRRLYHERAVSCIFFSSKGKYLATGGFTFLKLWDLDTDTCLSNFGDFGTEIHAMSMTPDDRWIVTASEGGSIRFWDRKTGKTHCIFDAHEGIIKSIAICPIRGCVATASEDSTVRIWSYGPRRKT